MTWRDNADTSWRSRESALKDASWRPAGQANGPKK